MICLAGAHIIVRDPAKLCAMLNVQSVLCSCRRELRDVGYSNLVTCIFLTKVKMVKIFDFL